MTQKAAASDYRATPYLSCRDAQAALDWYLNVFKATEIIRLADDAGTLMHAELRIGNAPVMLADEFPNMGYVSPMGLGGATAAVYVHVENVDEIFAAALENGATEILPVTDHFDGDRRGTLKDPFGHVWLLATKIEEVSFAEIENRFQKMMKGED